MTLETIDEVLDWTQRLHANLADCLTRASHQTHQERLRMLLDYLALHERELSQTLTLAKGDAQTAATHTWCTEYFDKLPFERETLDKADFSTMNAAEVMNYMTAIHDRIADLYRYLSVRAEVTSSQELLTNLLSLEEHEAMRMVRNAKEMEDL